MKKLIGILVAAFSLVLASGSPAHAAAPQWFDISTTIQPYIVSLGSPSTQYAKIVVAVQGFTSTGVFIAQDITALRTRCAIRNLDGSIISGVKISECAFGSAAGGAALNNNTTDALDGGGCCANSFSPLRFVHYDADGNSYIGRATACWRFISNGQLACVNFNSINTPHLFVLGV